MATVAVQEPQHMVALRRANEVRSMRGELKREILAGRTPVESVILDPPPYAWTMTIAELLISQRRWGESRARRFCAGLALPETKTVGSLTERQRLLLAVHLSDAGAASTDRDKDLETVLRTLARVQGLHGVLTAELTEVLGWKSNRVSGLLRILKTRGRVRGLPERVGPLRPRLVWKVAQ